MRAKCTIAGELDYFLESWQIDHDYDGDVNEGLRTSIDTDSDGNIYATGQGYINDETVFFILEIDDNGNLTDISIITPIDSVGSEILSLDIIADTFFIYQRNSWESHFQYSFTQLSRETENCNSMIYELGHDYDMTSLKYCVK